MSLQNFIPAVWSAKILTSLKNSLVYGLIANRDYEGDIKDKGDRVKINSIGDVTIKTYTKNTDIDAPETLTDEQKELVIDQAKYFNFQVDDVDKAQQTPKVIGSATQNAGFGLANTVDTFLASLYTGTVADNMIGSDSTPINFSVAGDAYEYIVNIGIKLTEANVPLFGRWIIIPAWMYGMLQKDSRFVKAGTGAQDNALYNGIVGKASGFDIYVSNNVPVVTTTGENPVTSYKVQAGYAGTLSFAAQILKTEAYKPEKRFGEAIKGLNVYGGKLVRPSTMVVLSVKRY